MATFHPLPLQRHFRGQGRVASGSRFAGQAHRRHDRPVYAVRSGRATGHDAPRVPLRPRSLHLVLDFEQGTHVEKFESEFRTFVGTGHGIAVSNGTVACILPLSRSRSDRATRSSCPTSPSPQPSTPCSIVGPRRSSSTSIGNLVHEPRGRATRLHATDQGHHPGASLWPPRRDRADREFAAERGISMIEDCAEAHGALYDGRAGRPIRRRRLLLLLRQQDRDHRRRRHVYDQLRALAASLRLLRDHGSRQIARTGTNASASTTG